MVTGKVDFSRISVTIQSPFSRLKGEISSCACQICKVATELMSPPPLGAILTNKTNYRSEFIFILTYMLLNIRQIFKVASYIYFNITNLTNNKNISLIFFPSQLF